MILFILTLSTLCVYSSQQTPETFQFQESDAIVKRQITSYKSNIIHHDPKYKNGQAESIIQFEMFPNVQPEEQDKQVKPQNSGHYNPQPTEQQNEPKFSFNYKGGNNRNVAQHLTEQKPAQQQLVPFNNRVPTASPYIPQSQAINVGYSVSFAGKPDTKQKFSKQIQDGAEIITGFRKETVRQPTANFQSSYSPSPSIDLKKTKTPTNKPKSNFATINQNNDAKKFINTLSSQPFEYFSKSQKPNRTTSTRIIDAENSESVTSSAWMNLSPYVELYRSKEQNQNLNVFKEQQKQPNLNLLISPQVFDFTNIYDTQTQKTLTDFNRNVFGRSEKGQTKPTPVFDFSNIYNTQTEKLPSEPIQENANGRNEQAHTNFLPINYPSEDFNTQQVYQPFNQLGSIPVVDPGKLQAQQTESFPQVSRPVLDISKLMQQYPVESSLLRDYIRPIETTALQQKAPNPQLLNIGGSTNQVQNNFDYSGRQISNFANMNYQNHYQGTNQVNTYLPEWSQGKSNFDSYFDYKYSSRKPHESQTKSTAQENGENYGNYGTRPKPVRSIEIHTDLQPPPESSRSRRHFMY